MSVFQYEAVDVQGVLQRGSMAVGSRRVAIRSLIQQGLTPLSVLESNQGREKTGRVPLSAVCGFYSKLADLLSAQIPLLESLKITVDVTTNKSLKAILQQIQTQVTDGKDFASALSEHPQVFSSVAMSVIKAGLEGAFLDRALNELMRLSQRQQTLQSKIRGAVAYPAFLVFVGALLMTTLLLVFVPKFEPMFEGLRHRGELPWMTEVLFQASRHIGRYWFYLLMCGAGGILLLVRWFRSGDGKRSVAAFLLRVGFLRNILVELALARFSRVLSALLENGVTIDHALRLCSTASGNPILDEVIAEAADKVEKGGTLSKVLKDRAWVPTDFSEMVTVGEQTNRLGAVLSRTSDIYDRKSEETLTVMLRFLEPILLLLMGVIITFFVFALMLPIMQSSSLVS